MKNIIGRTALLCLALASLPAAAADEKKASTSDNPEFVKGELSSLGVTKLQVKDTRVGLRLGGSQIGSVYYIVGSFELDFNWKSLGVGISAPARIPLYDPSRVGGLRGQFLPDGLALRPEDYDEVSEILRVLRFLRWGRKEDNLYVNLATESAATIGHGGSIRRYLANVDVDRGKLSAEVDAYGKYGGGELFVGDLLQPHRMVGAIAFLKPFGGSEKLPLQRLSIGATYAADLDAPYRLQRDPTTNLPLLPVDGSKQVPLIAESRRAQIVGLSIETKVVKTSSVDIKPYVEMSKLIGGGAGVSVGGLGRFTFGSSTKHALRAIGELRTFQGNFLPGYFDTFYEIQKYQYIVGKANAAADQTKLFDVLNRANDLKAGYYAELQYSLVDEFAVTAAWEDSNAKGGRNLVLHAEVPAWERLRFFASVHRRAVEEDLLALGENDARTQLKADNTLMFAGARLKILPILYLNGRVFRQWQIDTVERSYRNIQGFEVDLELGYEFSRD